MPRLNFFAAGAVFQTHEVQSRSNENSGAAAVQSLKGTSHLFNLSISTCNTHSLCTKTCPADKQKMSTHFGAFHSIHRCYVGYLMRGGRAISKCRVLLSPREIWQRELVISWTECPEALTCHIWRFWQKRCDKVRNLESDPEVTAGAKCLGGLVFLATSDMQIWHATATRSWSCLKLLDATCPSQTFVDLVRHGAFLSKVER